MYHWFLIIKYYNRISSGNYQLVAGTDAADNSGIRKEIFQIWFWLGLVESIPYILGLLLSAWGYQLLFPFDYAIAGIIISIVLTIAFSSMVPEPPISIQNAEKKDL